MSIIQRVNDSKLIGYLNGTIYASCDDLDAMIDNLEAKGMNHQDLFRLVFATEWIKMSYRVAQKALELRFEKQLSEEDWKAITDNVKKTYKPNTNGRTEKVGK